MDTDAGKLVDVALSFMMIICETLGAKKYLFEIGRMSLVSQLYRWKNQT